MALRWSNTDDKKGLTNKFKNIFQSKEPIKPKFEEARRRLQMQISKLNTIYIKLSEKDKMLFTRIVKCIHERDTQTATILSNELAQVRKLKSMVNYARLSLEQINIRMGTISELGDIVVTLSPAMSIINNVKNDITNMMPEVSKDINDVTNIINEIMIDSTNIPSGNQFSTMIENDNDVQQILEEATAMIEKDVKDRLPDLPSSMQVNDKPSFMKIGNGNAKRYPDLPSIKGKKRVETAI